MRVPAAGRLAQRRPGWARSALSPLDPHKLEVLGDGAAAPGLGGPARSASEVQGVRGAAVGPPAETVPCVNPKGQGCGPAGPGLREGPVLLTSVR